LLDIALVIHKFRPEIDWQKLILIAGSWGAESVTLLALKLVETQLKVPIPAELVNSLLPEGIPPSLLEQARSQLLGRERFGDQLTPDLVKMNTSRNLISKIKIGFQRIFIPRLALARLYNVPPTSPKIYGLYWVRLWWNTKQVEKQGQDNRTCPSKSRKILRPTRLDESA